MSPINAKGFALPAAIFVVVVLGVAVIYMGRMNTTQAMGSALSVQANRAYWAAQSGVEWAINQITGSNSCFASPTTLPALPGSLSNYSIQVSCSRRTYREGSSVDNLFIYEIDAEASYGSGPSDPDYVYRKVQATLSVKT
ncbi:MAG: hypothetical protein MI976_23790 [Pseudomonadales bacterium]|nr:hypothetical protein [Pseudomonadales bacterium]